MKVGGISKTILPNSKSEFTIHVPSEYDYRFISDKYINNLKIINRRDEIIEIIKYRFVEK